MISFQCVSYIHRTQLPYTKSLIIRNEAKKTKGNRNINPLQTAQFCTEISASTENTTNTCQFHIKEYLTTCYIVFF